MLSRDFQTKRCNMQIKPFAITILIIGACAIMAISMVMPHAPAPLRQNDGTPLFLPIVVVPSTPEPAEPFQFSDNVLTVTTRQLVVKITDGAITFLQDRRSAEILLDADPHANWPSVEAGFVGFTSEAADGTRFCHWPTQASSVTFQTLAPNRAQLRYAHLSNESEATQSELIIDVIVDTTSHEVILQSTGNEGNPTLHPVAIDLPIVNFKQSAVILGSGARYLRTDPDAITQTTYGNFGLNGPSVAVGEGTEAVFAVWSEATEPVPQHIKLHHTPDYDHVVLHAEQDSRRTDHRQIVSPAWRLGAYPTWLDAARRWRTQFELRTGARPLWENRVAWVRDVHAVYYATNLSNVDLPAKLMELAGMIDPSRVVYFLWNGDRIVLYGDPTLVDQIGRPTDEERELVTQYGWPFLLYHPFNLIYSDAGATDRLSFLAARNWLPSGYQFEPDYVCISECWRLYWQDIIAPLGGDTRFDVIHPGADRFKEYLVRNLTNYAERYQANGIYFDLLGDVGVNFQEPLAVVDGDNYASGEVATLIALAETRPELAVMSEYQPTRLVPYAFYAWEGSSTHIKQSAYVDMRINHPLRTALLGSYAWTRESNTEYIDDTAAALLGTLPEISLVGDHDVTDARARWSQARAKLFCEEELFNDLPEDWEAGVLAYYRSQRTGHWFTFRPVDATYGYVEILPTGEQQVRLTK